MADIPLHAFTLVTTERRAIRATLIGISVFFVSLLLLAPPATIFATALNDGWRAAAEGISSPDALSAIRLTLTVAAIAVPLNVVFGIAAAWRSPSSTSMARLS